MVPFLYHLFHMWRMIENWKMPQNKISHVAFCRSRGFTELWAFYGSRLFDFIIANSHKAVSLLVHYWQFHRKGDKSIHIYNLYLFFTLLLDRKKWRNNGNRCRYFCMGLSYICTLGHKGPFIKDVITFSRFLAPPLSSSVYFCQTPLKNDVQFWHTPPPPPK